MTSIFIKITKWLCLILAFTFSACETKLNKILTVGTNIWPGYQTLYLARDLGIFDDQPIKLIEMPSSTETALAFRNGSLDVAALTLDEALTLRQYIPTLKIILIMDISMGADVLLAQPEIENLMQLKGKRIGVENTAVGAVLLQGALQQAGLNVADVIIVPTTLDRHESAFAEHKIDAIVTFEPVKSKLSARDARQLFDSSQIPGRIIDILVTRQETIDHYADLLKTLLAGHFQALAHFRQHPENAFATIAANLALTPELAPTQFDGLELPDLAANRHWLNAKANTPLSTWITTLATLMQEQGLLFKAVATDHFIDDSLLPAQADENAVP